MRELGWRLLRGPARSPARRADQPNTALRERQLAHPTELNDVWRPSLVAAVGLWTVILGVAVGLRAWGLTWGGSRIDLNPDEFLILRTASAITWSDPNPHFYNYCGFIFHLSFLTDQALRLVGVTLSDWGRLLMHRLWSVFWGTATVVIVFHLTRRLGGTRRAAFIAAGLMAVLPLHVWESHFGTTDAPLLFWLMASFLASVVAYERPTWVLAAVSGLLTGFATGTKYPGAFGGVPFATAMALSASQQRLPGRAAAGRLGVFAVAAVLGSFLASPYSYLDAIQTVQTFLFEYRNVEQGHFGFDLNAPGWQYHRYVYELVAAFPFGFGMGLYLVIVPGLVAFLRQSGVKKLIPLTFVIVYFGVTGSWVFVPVRYFLPLFPILIIMAAWFLDGLLRRRAILGAAVLTLVFGYTTAFASSTTHRFTNDTRIQAAAWADQSLAPGSVVLMAHTRSRFSYVVRLDPDKFRSRVVSLRALPRTARDYRRRLDRRDPGAPTAVYVCASGLDFVRYYRSGVPESIKAWDELRVNPTRYRRIRTFEAHYLHKAFYQRLDPMFASYFVSPRLEFYEYVP